MDPAMSHSREALAARDEDCTHIDLERLRRIPERADPGAVRGYARRGDELFHTGRYVGEIEHVVPAPNGAGLRIVVRRP
jgi:hypothetical protein